MKVMQVNCTNRGSVGKIMNTIGSALSEHGDTSILCYSLGDETDPQQNRYKVAGWLEPRIHDRVVRFTAIPYGFAPVATQRLIQRIRVEKPDIVHLHCPNSTMNVYRLLRWLQKHKIPVVLTNHCEMFYTGNCAYSFDCEGWMDGCKNCKHSKDYCRSFLFNRTDTAWNHMYHALHGFEKIAITSVSEWVYHRSSVAPITGRYPNVLIENAIDTSVYFPRIVNASALKKQFGIPENKKMVLFVTAKFNLNPSDIKGGYYLVELAKQMIGEDLLFVVVGSREKTAGLPQNIVDIGRVENEDKLSELYSIADLSLVLSKKETFSMPCAESQCCGTPIVGFRAGGPESISIPAYAEFCEYGNLEAVQELILKWVDRKEKNSIQIATEAHAKFNEKRMTEQYRNIYCSLVNQGIDEGNL